MSDVPRGYLSYSVDISPSSSFHEAARALAVKTAEFTGCPAMLAGRLGQALAAVLAAVASGGGESAVALRFDSRPGEVTVDVQGPADVSIERALGEVGGRTLGSLVDRVEIARSDGREHCRLTCLVP
jgi:hypothetical protein